MSVNSESSRPPRVPVGPPSMARSISSSPRIPRSPATKPAKSPNMLRRPTYSPSSKSLVPDEKSFTPSSRASAPSDPPPLQLPLSQSIKLPKSPALTPSTSQLNAQPTLGGRSSSFSSTNVVSPSPKLIGLSKAGASVLPSVTLLSEDSDDEGDDGDDADDLSKSSSDSSDSSADSDFDSDRPLSRAINEASNSQENQDSAITNPHKPRNFFLTESFLSSGSTGLSSLVSSLSQFHWFDHLSSLMSPSERQRLELISRQLLTLQNWSTQIRSELDKQHQYESRQFDGEMGELKELKRQKDREDEMKELQLECIAGVYNHDMRQKLKAERNQQLMKGDRSATLRGVSSSQSQQDNFWIEFYKRNFLPSHLKEREKSGGLQASDLSASLPSLDLLRYFGFQMTRQSKELTAHSVQYFNRFIEEKQRLLPANLKSKLSAFFHREHRRSSEAWLGADQSAADKSQEAEFLSGIVNDSAAAAKESKRGGRAKIALQPPKIEHKKSKEKKGRHGSISGSGSEAPEDGHGHGHAAQHDEEEEDADYKRSFDSYYDALHRRRQPNSQASGPSAPGSSSGPRSDSVGRSTPPPVDSALDPHDDISKAISPFQLPILGEQDERSKAIFSELEKEYVQRETELRQKKRRSSTKDAASVYSINNKYYELLSNGMTILHTAPPMPNPLFILAHTGSGPKIYRRTLKSIKNGTKKGKSRSGSGTASPSLKSGAVTPAGEQPSGNLGLSSFVDPKLLRLQNDLKSLVAHIHALTQHSNLPKSPSLVAPAAPDAAQPVYTPESASAALAPLVAFLSSYSYQLDKFLGLLERSLKRFYKLLSDNEKFLASPSATSYYSLHSALLSNSSQSLAAHHYAQWKAKIRPDCPLVSQRIARLDSEAQLLLWLDLSEFCREWREKHRQWESRKEEIEKWNAERIRSAEESRAKMASQTGNKRQNEKSDGEEDDEEGEEKQNGKRNIKRQSSVNSTTATATAIASHSAGEEKSTDIAASVSAPSLVIPPSLLDLLQLSTPALLTQFTHSTAQFDRFVDHFFTHIFTQLQHHSRFYYEIYFHSTQSKWIVGVVAENKAAGDEMRNESPFGGPRDSAAVRRGSGSGSQLHNSQRRGSSPSLFGLSGVDSAHSEFNFFSKTQLSLGLTSDGLLLMNGQFAHVPSLESLSKIPVQCTVIGICLDLYLGSLQLVLDNGFQGESKRIPLFGYGAKHFNRVEQQKQMEFIQNFDLIPAFQLLGPKLKLEEKLGQGHTAAAMGGHNQQHGHKTGLGHGHGGQSHSHSHGQGDSARLFDTAVRKNPVLHPHPQPPNSFLPTESASDESEAGLVNAPTEVVSGDLPLIGHIPPQLSVNLGEFPFYMRPIDVLPANVTPESIGGAVNANESSLQQLDFQALRKLAREREKTQHHMSMSSGSSGASETPFGQLTKSEFLHSLSQRPSSLVNFSRFPPANVRIAQAILKVQRIARRYIGFQRRKHLWSQLSEYALKIQCVWRGFLARRRFKYEKRAREIQRIWRGYRTRKLMTVVRRTGRKWFLVESACIRIQAAIRARNARRKFAIWCAIVVAQVEHIRYLMVLIQRIWRNKIARRKWKEQQDRNQILRAITGAPALAGSEADKAAAVAAPGNLDVPTSLTGPDTQTSISSGDSGGPLSDAQAPADSFTAGSNFHSILAFQKIYRSVRLRRLLATLDPKVGAELSAAERLALQRQRMYHAAIEIQRVWRGHRDRQFVKIKRNVLMRDFMVLRDAWREYELRLKIDAFFSGFDATYMKQFFQILGYKGQQKRRTGDHEHEEDSD